MVNTFLVPEQTVEKNGEGAAVELGDAIGQKFSLTLRITRVIEQEALEVTVWGSEDGATFPAKLLSFPQQFYTAEKRLALDLTGQPQIRYIRAKWEVNRWGRGAPRISFTFSVAIEQLLGQLTA